tara:strand:- start:330 stop:527 length:198 start_codon:yes stop_codon:yes gene_type:complete
MRNGKTERFTLYLTEDQAHRAATLLRVFHEEQVGVPEMSKNAWFGVLLDAGLERMELEARALQGA